MDDLAAVHRRELRSFLLALPIAALFGALIASNTGSLGGWGTLGALVLSMAVLGVAVAAFMMRQWRRPFAWGELEAEVAECGLDPAKLGETVSPRDVESGLRRLMVNWASELDHSDSATVLIHPHLHTDYDARIVDHDGDEQDVRVYLLQIKARPVPSAIKHFAETMEREDAYKAVMITARSSFEQAYNSGILKTAEDRGIFLSSMGALHNLIHGGHATVEIYVEDEPPAAEAPVLVGR